MELGEYLDADTLEALEKISRRTRKAAKKARRQSVTSMVDVADKPKAGAQGTVSVQAFVAALQRAGV